MRSRKTTLIVIALGLLLAASLTTTVLADGPDTGLPGTGYMPHWGGYGYFGGPGMMPAPAHVWGYDGSYGPWYGGYGPGASGYGYLGGPDMMPAPAHVWGYDGGYRPPARGNTPYTGNYGYYSGGSGMMPAPAHTWGSGRTTTRGHGRHGW
jgi:hypothetical protein